MNEWEKLHYAGRSEELERLVQIAHGKDAWYQVQHKGGISVYEPMPDNPGCSTRIAHYRCFSDLETAAEKTRAAA